MSRHRNVRSLNYSDEYDGYDDEYGHSVEDEYCISPSDAAQFMYDRNRQSTQISAFFDEADNIAEEDEAEESVGNVRRSSGTFQKPPLSELEEVRLQSCLDEIRNVIGDTIPENIIVETILKYSFDLSKSLDALLSYEPSISKTGEPKPQRERKERNRDDDFSDFYIGVQSHLTRTQEHPHFSIHCKSLKPQHNYLNRDFLLLNHLAVDSANLSPYFNVNQSNLPKEFSLTVSERTEKCNQNSLCGTTNISKNSGILKMYSDSSSDIPKTGNSCLETQLKFHIPRLHKLRKDSDKENIAEGDDSDSDETAFSSLAALAKQYSMKNIITASEEEAEMQGISQTEILRQEPTASSLINCATTSEFFIQTSSHRTVSDELVTGDESLDTTDTPNSANKGLLSHKQHCDQYSENERHMWIDNVDVTPEFGMVERFSKLSTQNADESAGSLESPALLSDKKSKFPLVSHVPCLRKVKSNDKSFSSEKQNLPSLSEIVRDHLLHKSSSDCDNPRAISNYDVMKSESCPQFVIPRLHIAEKRRGVSESLSDDVQDLNISSMDNAVADEDSETDNWVIDLKYALKHTQRECIKDYGMIDSLAQDKCFPIDLTSLDHVFVPDLPCLLDASDELSEKPIQSRREPSAFGRVLCRKWRVHHVKHVCEERRVSEKISRFTFNTPSPDDIILKYLGLK